MWIPIVREEHGKTQTFKNFGFLKHFLWSRNLYNFQNIGKLNSHSTGKFEKTQIFQAYGFLTYFTWSRNPYNSQTMGWMNFHITEQVLENTDNFQVLLYLPDLELMKTHTIPDVWEKTHSYNMEIFCGKTVPFPGCRFLKKFFFPISWRIDGNTHIFPTHGLERFFLLIHSIPKTWGKRIRMVS